MSNKKINIGITIIVKDSNDVSLFTNGIRQNVLLLAELFNKCQNVDKSYIINTAHENPASANFYPDSLISESFKFISMSEAEHLCDLIVICHGSLSEKNCQRYTSKGIKIVKQVLGAERSLFDESVLFQEKTPRNIYDKQGQISAIWISPHFYERDKYFHETINNCPVHEANYLWSPKFIEKHQELLKNNKKDDKTFTGLYQPTNKKQKRLCTMEPNLNMVKTFTIPLVIAELYYRKYPEEIEMFSIFGGKKFSKHKDVIDIATNLSIHKNKKCFFENRYPVVWSLTHNADILICHQNECELNYLYLDASWLGFPVVHNSLMMKEIGWYYPGNDADAAIKHLHYISNNFDSDHYENKKYIKKSRKQASKYFLDKSHNIECYEILIDKAMIG